jgi:hypothetical protein
MSDFHEISFLRSNALELRKIALVEPPTIAADLRRIAQDWDGRADVLEVAAGNRQQVFIAA